MRAQRSHSTAAPLLCARPHTNGHVFLVGGSGVACQANHIDASHMSQILLHTSHISSSNGLVFFTKSSSMRFLTLDATGTLLRPRVRVGATYLDYWQRVASSSLPSERVESLAPLVDQRFLAAFRRHSQLSPNFGRARGDSIAQQWWSDVILDALPAELVNALSTNAKDELSASLYAHYATSAAWQVFDETTLTLATLRSMGVEMAVISDFDERLPVILEQLGLAQYLSVVTTSWEVGATKPTPAIFHHTFSQLTGGAAVDPTAFLHVGDHATRDYYGARSVGAHARLLVRSGSHHGVDDGVPASHIMSSLRDTIAHCKSTRTKQR